MVGLKVIIKLYTELLSDHVGSNVSHLRLVLVRLTSDLRVPDGRVEDA